MRVRWPNCTRGLWDAVLDQRGAADVLDGLARSNLLLVPLDRRGQWSRYHHLFRDMLLARLERTESGMIPVLRRRAGAGPVDPGSVATAASDRWLMLAPPGSADVGPT